MWAERQDSRRKCSQATDELNELIDEHRTGRVLMAMYDVAERVALSSPGLASAPLASVVRDVLDDACVVFEGTSFECAEAMLPSFLQGHGASFRKALACIVDPDHSDIPYLRIVRQKEVRAAVARDLLSYPDADLGVLAYQLDPDYAVEALDLAVSELSGRLSLADRVKAEALATSAAGRYLVADEESKRHKERFDVAGKRGAAAIDAVLKTFPGTGETHDLAEMIRSFRVGFAGGGDGIDCRRNRLLCRISFWSTYADMRWNPAGREVLASLIQAPNRFVHYQPATPEGCDAKARLRQIRKSFCGSLRPVERESLLAVLRDNQSTDEDVLMVLWEYLDAREGGASACPALGALDREFDRMYWASKHSVLRHADLPLSVYCYAGRAHLRTAVDAEIERLAADEDAVVAEFNRPMVFKNPSDPAAGQPPRLPVFRFEYVLNPESTMPKVVVAEADEENALSVVSEILQQHADASVPIPSLARAVLHYAFDLTDAQRQLWNKEERGGHTFHKLKRGKSRLYVRRSQETITFHVYARRDWRKSRMTA